MVSNLVVNTLVELGINVTDIGFSTKPKIEVAVTFDKTDGGIIITVSHNPKQWNALKLLNGKGEFLNGVDGKEILSIAENNSYVFSEVDDLGKFSVFGKWILQIESCHFNFFILL